MPTSAITATAFTAGSLPVVTSDSANIRRQLDALSLQVGTGQVARTYGGLGSSAAATSLTLNAAVGRTETWQVNAAAADGRMRATQSALTQMNTIASNLFSQTNSLNGLSGSEVDSIAASARDALRQMAGLVDTRFGELYVFAGTDTANPPIPDPEGILASGFATDIRSAVGQLAVNGATATLASTLATASSNAAGVSPFSATLSQPAAALANLRPVVQIGTNQFVATGIIAGTNADATSTGSSTTGSYMRDIMRALATIGSLSSGQTTVAGFGAVALDVHTSLGDAITALNNDAGLLGNHQAVLTETSLRLDDTSIALKTQISNVEEVDMADVLTRLSATQTQLQVSYKLMSMIQSLSLVNYLS